MFCECPTELAEFLAQTMYFRTKPLPFRPMVAEWCASNLRAPCELTCIGNQVGDHIFYEYYLDFEDEVDMMMFKMKWFDYTPE